MFRPGGKSKKRLNRILWHLPLPAFAINFGVRLPLRHPAVTSPIRRDIFFGEYEDREAEIVSNKLEADDVVMEVGAGIGFLSSLCAQKIGGDRVFAYEANPQLIDPIREVHALNGVSPSVANVLLGKGEGEQTFYIEPDYWASSLIRSSDGAQAVRVKQIDFNTEIARISPTFLIIDIEGGEYELLKEAKLGSIRKICVETHPHALGYGLISEMLGRLIDCGFALDIGRIRKNVLYLFKEKSA